MSPERVADYDARRDIAVIQSTLEGCQRERGKDIERLYEKVRNMGERLDGFHDTLEAVATDVKTLISNGAKNGRSGERRMARGTKIWIAVLGTLCSAFVALINAAASYMTTMATQPVVAKTVEQAVEAAAK